MHHFQLDYCEATTTATLADTSEARGKYTPSHHQMLDVAMYLQYRTCAKVNQRHCKQPHAPQSISIAFCCQSAEPTAPVAKCQMAMFRLVLTHLSPSAQIFRGRLPSSRLWKFCCCRGCDLQGNTECRPSCTKGLRICQVEIMLREHSSSSYLIVMR